MLGLNSKTNEATLIENQEIIVIQSERIIILRAGCSTATSCPREEVGQKPEIVDYFFFSIAS